MPESWQRGFVTRLRRGVFPGSFNPPTHAHLAIAAAALEAHRLDRIVFSVSRISLGKSEVLVPTFDDRVTVLHAEAAEHEWLEVVVTDAQLIADIAQGYDVVIMGADKWTQINEPDWYGSDAERDRVLATLPTVVVAPRDGHEFSGIGPEQTDLDTPEPIKSISSTGARAGQRAWMAPAAQRFDSATGAWTDPARYQRRQASNRARR